MTPGRIGVSVWLHLKLNSPQYFVSVILGWKVWWTCSLFHGLSHWGWKRAEIRGDARGRGTFARFQERAQGQYLWRNQPLQRRFKSHDLLLSLVKLIRVDAFIFSIYFEGVDGCLAGSGSQSAEYSMSGWGDFSLLSSRLDNHHKVLGQRHQNPLWRSKCEMTKVFFN